MLVAGAVVLGKVDFPNLWKISQKNIAHVREITCVERCHGVSADRHEGEFAWRVTALPCL